MRRRGVEVAHHGARRLLRLRVRAVRRHVRQQATQGFALLLDALVAGGQHFQRRLETGGRAAVAGQGDGSHVPQHAIARRVPERPERMTPMSATVSTAPEALPRSATSRQIMPAAAVGDFGASHGASAAIAPYRQRTRANAKRLTKG